MLAKFRGSNDIRSLLYYYRSVCIFLTSKAMFSLCSTAYWLSSTSRYIASVSGHSTDHYDFAYPTDNSCDAPSQTLTNSHMPACFWFHVKFFSVVFLSMYLNSHHNLQFAPFFFSHDMR